MGDAKRRKQLGLMPTVLPFEVLADREGTLSFVTGPDDPAKRTQLSEALQDFLPTGAHWDQWYRTRWVQAGRADRPLRTREDVEKIAVPPQRRFIGELVTLPGGEPPHSEDYVRVEGNRGEAGPSVWMHLRRRQVAFAGQGWQDMPDVGKSFQMMKYLAQHPVSKLQGELRGRYTAEQTRDGALSWTPQPPDEWRAALDALARSWHGETPKEWNETHAEMVWDSGNADPQAAPQALRKAAPQALRTTFELRDPAPLRAMFDLAIAHLGELDVYPADGRLYSLDGQTWLEYREPDDEDAGEAEEKTGEYDFEDWEAFDVTVWADGRVEWLPDDVPAEQVERLRADLLAYTGAADAQAWASYSADVLEDLRPDWVSERQGSAGPIRGVRLQVVRDYLGDPEATVEALAIEDEVSFDGETWLDLYEDDLPEP